MVNIETYQEGPHHIVVVEGDIDASSSIHLDEALTELSDNPEVKSILVDGNKLEYISSAGLGVFMSYIDDFKTKGIQLVLFGLSEKVMNVFQILGLDQLLMIESDKETAKRRFNEVQS